MRWHPAPIDAELRSAAFFSGALGRSDMLLDVLHLLIPAAAVHAEGLQAALGRDLVEAGFERSGANACGNSSRRSWRKAGVRSTRSRSSGITRLRS